MMKLLSVALLTGSLSVHAAERGVVGIRYADHPEGLVVTRVLDESGAKAAGIVTGDRIVSVDGVDVTTGEDTPPLRGEMGSTVTLGVVRPLSAEPVVVTVERGTAKKQSAIKGSRPVILSAVTPIR